jgi:hypothetical protein
MDDYLGFSGESVYALGKVVILAGRVEGCAVMIAHMLAIDVPPTMRFPKITKEIKTRLADDGVPPWSSCTADDVRHWVGAAKWWMDRRDTYFHAQFVHRRLSGEWQPIALQRKHERDHPSHPTRSPCWSMASTRSCATATRSLRRCNARARPPDLRDAHQAVMITARWLHRGEPNTRRPLLGYGYWPV